MGIKIYSELGVLNEEFKKKENNSFWAKQCDQEYTLEIETYESGIQHLKYGNNFHR